MRCPRFAGALALVVGAAAPAWGQGVPSFSACYVPGVGAWYLIKETGLPTACLAPGHVEVSWMGSSGTVADSSITAGKIAAGAVGSAELADDAVIASKLGVSSVTAAAIATGAVGSAEIADGAISSTDLGPNSVTSLAIAPGAVGSSDIAAQAITSAHIATQAVGSNQIAAAAVTSSHLAAGAVATSDLANGAVTAAKLAPGMLTPIAYGFVSAACTFGAKSANVSACTPDFVQGRYEITLTGENYISTQYVTVVNFTGTIGSGFVTVWTDSASGHLVVFLRNAAGNPVAGNFSFVTFKP